MKLRLLPLVILAVMCSFLALALMRDPRIVGSPMLDKPLPTIQLSHGFTSEQWKGKVALVNMFASWCAPCQIEHPQLLALSKGGKLPIYGIAWKNHPKDVEEWLSTRGNPYIAVGLDEAGKTTVPLGLTGVPETFLIDRSGIVRFHSKQLLTQQTIDDELLPLVEQLHAK